jgi:hypothetical protein
MHRAAAILWTRRARAGIIWRSNQTDVAQHANSRASVKVDGALTRAPSRSESRLLKQPESGSDVALHREQRWHFVWRKKWQRKFFLFVRSMIEAIASGWRAGAFVLVLTLSAFRKIVGKQRQKKWTRIYWERTHETHRACGLAISLRSMSARRSQINWGVNP